MEKTNQQIAEEYVRSFIGTKVNGREVHHAAIYCSCHHGNPNGAWLSFSIQALGYAGESHCGIGSTMDAAIAMLAYQIGPEQTPEVIAEKKRQQAAALLAEADKLSPANATA